MYHIFKDYTQPGQTSPHSLHKNISSQYQISNSRDQTYLHSRDHTYLHRRDHTYLNSQDQTGLTQDLICHNDMTEDSDLTTQNKNQFRTMLV